MRGMCNVLEDIHGESPCLQENPPKMSIEREFMIRQMQMDQRAASAPSDFPRIEINRSRRELVSPARRCDLVMDEVVYSVGKKHKKKKSKDYSLAADGALKEIVCKKEKKIHGKEIDGNTLGDNLAQKKKRSGSCLHEQGLTTEQDDQHNFDKTKRKKKKKNKSHHIGNEVLTNTEPNYDCIERIKRKNADSGADIICEGNSKQKKKRKMKNKSDDGTSTVPVSSDDYMETPTSNMTAKKSKKDVSTTEINSVNKETNDDRQATNGMYIQLESSIPDLVTKTKKKKHKHRNSDIDADVSAIEINSVNKETNDDRQATNGMGIQLESSIPDLVTKTKKKKHKHKHCNSDIDADVSATEINSVIKETNGTETMFQNSGRNESSISDVTKKKKKKHRHKTNHSCDATDNQQRDVDKSGDLKNNGQNSHLKSKHKDKYPTGNSDEVIEVKLKTPSGPNDSSKNNGTKIDECNHKNADSADAGQWGTASFNSEERKQKFIRLLGGFKKSTGSDIKDSKTIGIGSDGGNLAMSKNAESSYVQRMESQFTNALSQNFRRGIGLGFERPPGSGSKFYIDKNMSKSKKFQDSD